MQLPFVIRKLLGIKVFALVGKSGTGKSFRARLIAEKYGIELIIDDGLLIKNDTIIAGKSAKNEKLYLTAIKTALFDTIEHRVEVRNKLHDENFTKILILGTSEGMVHKISKRLDLPKPSKIIKIEDIATEEEIAQALQERATGKHIIPIPTVEVEKNYADIISNSIRDVAKKGLFLFKHEKKLEKTVVHPMFSQQEHIGKITISHTALTQMIVHCADEFDSDIRIRKLKINQDNSGNYKIKLFISAPYKTQLSGNFHNFQQYIIQHLSKYTGIIIKEMNMEVTNLEKH